MLVVMVNLDGEGLLYNLETLHNMSPFSFGFKSTNSVSGISIRRGRRLPPKVTFPSGTKSFDTATHRVFVLTTSTEMTVQGNPTFSYWSGGSGGSGTGGCVGHSGSGGGGAGGLSKVTDDTFAVPAGQYTINVPGKGGGDTYIQSVATLTKYAEAYRGGYGVYNGTGGSGGCGGGGGAQ